MEIVVLILVFAVLFAIGFASFPTYYCFFRSE